MKKLIFTLFLLAICSTANAQSSKSQIDKSISKIESAKTANDYATVFNDLTSLRGSNVDDNWKIYYNAALAKYKEVEALFVNKNLTELNDKNWIAYKYATAAEDMKKDNVDSKKLVKLIEDQQQRIKSLK